MTDFDIWMPSLDFYNPKLADAFRAKGKDVWWYISGGPAHPYPNYFVFYPAIDCRILFWMNWKYHVRGFLYWGIDAWGDPSSSVNVRGRNGQHWPDIPWDSVASRSGDGYLVYPGKDGRLLIGDFADSGFASRPASQTLPKAIARTSCSGYQESYD